MSMASLQSSTSKVSLRLAPRKIDSSPPVKSISPDKLNSRVPSRTRTISGASDHSIEQAPYLTLSKPINHTINSDQNSPDEKFHDNRQNNSTQSGKASIYRANMALQEVEEMADEESKTNSQV